MAGGPEGTPHVTTNFTLKPELHVLTGQLLQSLSGISTSRAMRVEKRGGHQSTKVSKASGMSQCWSSLYSHVMI